MFLRTVKARGGEGGKHEYVRLVEAYREHGKNKQRIVCNLGRKDLLAEHLDALIALLHGERRGDRTKHTVGPVQAVGAWDWGPMLVARALWHELGLQDVLERPGATSTAAHRERLDQEVCERITALGLDQRGIFLEQQIRIGFRPLTGERLRP